MNIRKEHIDALNAVVKITIGKYEYTEKIENFLEVKRKTAARIRRVASCDSSAARKKHACRLETNIARTHRRQAKQR